MINKAKVKTWTFSLGFADADNNDVNVEEWIINTSLYVMKKNANFIPSELVKEAMMNHKKGQHELLKA